MELNDLKHINYAEQMTRLKTALKNEFYLESIFIEYSILEERTEAILIYCNSFPKPGTNGKVNIGKKISKIDNLANTNHSFFLDRYFDSEFMNKLRDWKDKRNPLIHELLTRENHTTELKELAEEGYELMKKLETKSINYKKYLERRGMLHTREEIK